MSGNFKIKSNLITQVEMWWTLLTKHKECAAVLINLLLLDSLASSLTHLCPKNSLGGDQLPVAMAMATRSPPAPGLQVRICTDITQSCSGDNRFDNSLTTFRFVCKRKIITHPMKMKHCSYIYYEKWNIFFVWHISILGVRRIILKFSSHAWFWNHMPDATFRHQVSDAIFQNYAPGIIFYFHASDGHYDSGYVEGYYSSHCVFYMDFYRRIRDWPFQFAASNKSQQVPVLIYHLN